MHNKKNDKQIHKQIENNYIIKENEKIIMISPLSNYFNHYEDDQLKNEKMKLIKIKHKIIMIIPLSNYFNHYETNQSKIIKAFKLKK